MNIKIFQRYFRLVQHCSKLHSPYNILPPTIGTEAFLEHNYCAVQIYSSLVSVFWINKRHVGELRLVGCDMASQVN